MSSNLRVSSFNCRNIKSSIPEIQELCSKSDIVLLQETWLMNYELPMLGQISSDFYAVGISAMDTGVGIVNGRPYGGLAFMWRKTLSFDCKPLTYNNETRILGLEIKSQSIHILFVNVYMPVCNFDNVEEFVLLVNRINNIMYTADTPFVYAIGDFNADLVKNNIFGDELSKFCSDEMLIITDAVYLNNMKTYTYFSEAHKNTSWIDHIICASNAHSLVSDVRVGYEYVTSDHLPLCINILCETTLYHVHVLSENVKNSGDSCKIKWDTLSSDDLNRYKMKSEISLNSIQINESLIACSDVTCTDQNHINSINLLYDSIINALHEAGKELQCNKSGNNFKAIPGWNDLCKEAHSDAREAFLLWRVNNSPKQGPVFDHMKITRARFKLILRQCKLAKDEILSDTLAKKLSLKDQKSFWSDVNKQCNSRSHVFANTIDGVTGNKEVCDFWFSHYRNLLNSNNDTSIKNEVLNSIKVGCVNNIESGLQYFTFTEVETAIKAMKKGKCHGIDGIFSEHFLFADTSVNDLFCKLINAIIVHGHLPGKALETLLVPIVKDKKCDITVSDNYRPIAIATIASKIIEVLLLNKYIVYLSSNDNQFGFKPKHSTDMCIFILKEIVDYYNSHSSPVYLCFMDASKAFDRVNHWYLFDKLVKRGLPFVIVRLLNMWYSTQQFFVKWCDITSSQFNVSNGVRQGGVLSPYLYNVFIDGLSKELNNCKVGCTINDCVINHVCYADDSVLIAPSPTALQYLIDICQSYALSNEIVYNAKKTTCMCIKPKKFKDLNVPNVCLNGKKLSWNTEHKYLGVYLCNDRSDNKDLSREVRAIYTRGNILLRKFGKCSDDVKRCLFKTYLSDFYCNQLWCEHSKQMMQKVKTAFNNVYRLLMDIPRAARISISKECVTHNIDSFNVIMRKSCRSFRDRLDMSANNIIFNTINSHFFLFKSKLNLAWHKLIF